MRNPFKYALVSVLWPSMILSTQIASVRADSEPDVTEIYKVLIGPENKKSMLILSTSGESTICPVNAKDITDPEFREAANAFNSVNRQVWDLGGVLSDRKTISESELKETFQRGVVEGWRRFRREHPNSPGYLTLSAIGFNNSHTVAIVSSGVQCGGTCGAGGLKYFRHTPKGWQSVAPRFPTCHWSS